MLWIVIYSSCICVVYILNSSWMTLTSWKQPWDQLPQLTTTPQFFKIFNKPSKTVRSPHFSTLMMWLQHWTLSPPISHQRPHLHTARTRHHLRHHLKNSALLLPKQESTMPSPASLGPPVNLHPRKTSSLHFSPHWWRSVPKIPHQMFWYRPCTTPSPILWLYEISACRHDTTDYRQSTPLKSASSPASTATMPPS